MDCTASTGACIHACRATRCHILAFDKDKDIFDALLAPMRHIVVIPQLEILPPHIVSVDLDEEDAPIQRIVKTSRFSKELIEVEESKRIPFFANLAFFPSPTKSFSLPSYAEDVFKASPELRAVFACKGRTVDPRVLHFIDDFAVASDSNTSHSEDSSTSSSRA